MDVTSQVLDGVAVAKEILKGVSRRASVLRDAGRAPRLATVLVGDDDASKTYVRMKVNRCSEVGIESVRIDLDAEISTPVLVAQIEALSADPAIDGILLQHPVPGHIDERAAFEAIDPAKDVDGVTRTSFAAMALGNPGFQSCTPGGILRLLDAYEIPLEGRHAVVVGRSHILGLPMGMLLLGRDATVTYCHSRTRGLAEILGRADVVVAAVGTPELVRARWLKPGAVVVDAGYSAGDRGDVEQPAAREVAGWLSPVPGGVGPMTIAMLLEQTVTAAERRAGG
ncbi:bifunctional 5,10-methylenetetrahydrofolate dehydrogenase/5,10-methenyltetrahydrofolate cyclohydrolase [Nocardioides humi]|uniref:bifunctional 5,10-methylenetetrahydrofolate dehydrogenase/5,10-methenyltetrahydrofolate cyclohydrolase n=1 Tax=Nocardioides humi TaxID=449461 RepID=UPI0015E871DF|nr:tetrahydrofolate dehydrogenase/cyclohydrolase catalytic domain-containing protein [Nocardioides humi]